MRFADVPLFLPIRRGLRYGSGRKPLPKQYFVRSPSRCWANPRQALRCEELEDGTECSIEGVDGTCFAGACVPVTCGNGATDLGEDCDDRNDDDADGCTGSCEYTCQNDEQCADGRRCNGAEKCIDVFLGASGEKTGQACSEPSEQIDVSFCPSDPCATYRCNESGDCVAEPIDSDFDGFSDCTEVEFNCDPFEARSNPNAVEVCDNIDNDCNDLVDDNAEATLWFRDDDGDRYGNPKESISSCEEVTGYEPRSGDCYDTDERARPMHTQSYSTPIEGCDPTEEDALGCYDYDCNGRIDFERNGYVKCRTTLVGPEVVCSGGGFSPYVGPLPEGPGEMIEIPEGLVSCGKAGTSFICKRSGPSCVPIAEGIFTQACR